MVKGSARKSPRKSAKREAVRGTGSRVQVMNGTARRTVGNLTKKDLKYNKSGKIVSKKKSSSAKKDNRLVKAGYKTEKGKFGSVFVDPKEKKKTVSLSTILNI